MLSLISWGKEARCLVNWGKGLVRGAGRRLDIKLAVNPGIEIGSASHYEISKRSDLKLEYSPILVQRQADSLQTGQRTLVE